MRRRFVRVPAAENRIRGTGDARDLSGGQPKPRRAANAIRRVLRAAPKLVSVGVNGDSAVINSPWCLT